MNEFALSALNSFVLYAVLTSLLVCVICFFVVLRNRIGTALTLMLICMLAFGAVVTFMMSMVPPSSSTIVGGWVETQAVELTPEQTTVFVQFEVYPTPE